MSDGKQQFTGGKQQFTGGKQQFTGRKQQFTGGKLQFTGGKQQFRGGQQQFTGGRQPFVIPESFTGGSPGEWLSGGVLDRTFGLPACGSYRRNPARSHTRVMTTIGPMRSRRRPYRTIFISGT